MKNFQNKAVPQTLEKEDIRIPSVREYMATQLITFTPETNVLVALGVLLKKRITGAPVVDEQNQLVGLIDDKDCLEVLEDRVYHNKPGHQGKVRDYMTNVMKTIPANTDILEVAQIFLKTRYKRLVVVDEKGKLAGQISRRDVLRAIEEMER